MALHTQLASTIAQRNLTKSAAAQTIGVAPASLTNVLTGSSLPNARSVPKYAKFLGISSAKLQAQIDSEKSSGRKRPGRTKAVAVKKTAKKTAKSSKRTLRPADRHMLAALKSSLKSIDQLRTKVEDAIARLEG